VNITADEYKMMLRQDLHSFIERSFYQLNPQTEFLPNWHIEIIADELNKCYRGETNRLIITVPPRSLKSHCASVAFPAWLLGRNPCTQIIAASYAQDLAAKHALDCRNVVTSDWFQRLFQTRLSQQRQAIQEFVTTKNGWRLATSVGGVLTGRGSDFIIIDDPLKPDEALSETQRKSVNNWFDHTVYSRLNNKRKGCIILIMQRLHEDDLVGHVQTLEDWRVLNFPAIAEHDEHYTIQTPFGERRFARKTGEALHPEREPLAVLNHIRKAQGEYNFAGQYQQSPAPLGGGMIESAWFKTYTDSDVPSAFELMFQSWDTANKTTELSDYTVCTTWGVKSKRLYLLHVLRRRMGYPELKRVIRQQAAAFGVKSILIEDKASGTQLIQDLLYDGVHGVTRYTPKMDKVMRLHSITNTIENRFVYLPEKAAWLADYLHELTTFPNGRYDDQADSTSQALEWIKDRTMLSGFDIWLHNEYRKKLTDQGRLEELSQYDEKYGMGML
jgi:predicted phage terminase large subunit-like protein